MIGRYLAIEESTRALHHSNRQQWRATVTLVRFERDGESRCQWKRFSNGMQPQPVARIGVVYFAWLQLVRAARATTKPNQAIPLGRRPFAFCGCRATSNYRQMHHLAMVVIAIWRRLDLAARMIVYLISQVWSTCVPLLSLYGRPVVTVAINKKNSKYR